MKMIIKTVVGLCMVLLLCAPCMAACPNSQSGGTCDSTCNGSGCSSGSSSCTDGSCSSCDSVDVYGAFKCSDGNCTTKVCEDGNCETSYLQDTSAKDSVGAAVCKDGTCQAKVCTGQGCETGTYSVSSDEGSFAALLAKLFGDSSDTQETPTTAYANPGTTTNFYGSYAGEPTEAPVAVEEEEVTEVVEEEEETVTPVCNSCKTTACGGTCEEVVETCPAKPVCNTTDATGACDNYTDVYAALRSDKTEVGILSSTYTSEDFATSLCENMTAKGVDCQLVKVTFTDKTVNYINSFNTCDGTLLIDACGTSLGTGIKKKVVTLEEGKQWESKSLSGTCPRIYTRGTVSSIEYL